jgi:hypothetical protein
MTSTTRTRTSTGPRTSTVDRILALIDDCLADVAAPRHVQPIPATTHRRRDKMPGC